MERINLNIPSDMRHRLRDIASERGATEAEVARELLVGAIEAAEREAWYRAVAAAFKSAELRELHLDVVRRMEQLDHGSR